MRYTAHVNPNPAVPVDKSALRRAMRALRGGLAASAPDACAQAAEHLPLERLPPYSVVAAYRPVGGELDPYFVADRLIARGSILALPVVERRDAPLVFRAWTPGEAMVPDALGVPAPPPTAQVLEPDLIIAPLLAFDRRGGRLGQGGGYYDRTLEALRGSRRLFVLGLAHAGQEVEAVPMDPNDQRLDAILTDLGYIEVG